MINISLISAITAGILSFISPCVLPIVIPFLCYMAGVEINEFRKPNGNIRIVLLKTTILFICGFTCVFVGLGATTWTIGNFFFSWKSQITFLSGLVIILLGINFLGMIRLSFLSREIRFHPYNFYFKSFVSFIMGGAFAFGWTPCIGPVLGSVLILAGSKETASEGIFLLIFYSLGFGIPFLLVSLFSSTLINFLTKLKNHLRIIEKVIGLFLITVGFLLTYRYIQNIYFELFEILR